MPRFYELSGFSTHFLSLDAALARADRARGVKVTAQDDASKLAKLRRVMRLDVTGSVPSCLGELRHLRMLTLRGSAIAEIPKAVWSLPMLKQLYIEGTGVRALDLSKAPPGLFIIAIRGTPLAEDPSAIAAAIATNPSFQHGGLGFGRKRAPSPAPTGAALLPALLADEIDEMADLHGANLRGVEVEDALIMNNLRGADLSGSVWRRCDFNLAELAEANLEGARFEDCQFDTSSRPAEGVRAKGVTFERCAITLRWTNADVSEARIVDCEEDPDIDIQRSNAAGLVLQATFSDEASVGVDFPGSKLAGATLRFDLTAGRRAELEAKPNPRLKWATKRPYSKTLLFADIERDDATRIDFAPLPGAKVAKSKTKSTTKSATKSTKSAPAAPCLGAVYASNAMLWLLVIDAKDAAPWSGSGDDGNHPDFQRAMEVDAGAIEVGDHRGQLVQVGDCGGAYVWGVEGGIALFELRSSGHVGSMSKPALLKALGERVSSFPVGEQQALGDVEVKCGCLALLLPYVSGKLSAAAIEAGAKKAKNHGDDRLLVPLPNGTYRITRHRFAPEPGYEDELGSYGDGLRILRQS